MENFKSLINIHRRYHYQSMLILLVLLMVRQVPAWATSPNKTKTLQQYISLFYSSSETWNPELEKLQKEIVYLQRKENKYKDEVQFIQYMFYRIHRKYLKNYSLYSPVPQLLEKGKYDCISGTALYALCFELLDIAYEIRETPYHVYLLAYTQAGQKILIESTDPMSGCITDPVVINKYIETINAEAEKDGQHYLYQHVIDNTITLQQLAGLQYFNVAVYYFNQKDVARAKVYLDKASAYYNSLRMREFRNLLLSSR